MLSQARTDHVGSLLRPERLTDAFRKFALGGLSRDELRAAQDAAIREVVARQEAIGLPVVTDGEFRRLNWQVSFSEVEGWDLWSGSWKKLLQNPGDRAAHETPLQKGDDAVVSFRVRATARLRLAENFPLAEYRFLRSVARGPVKITLMGADRVAQMCDLEGSKRFYRGCDYVQIDEPSYTGYVDPATLERMRARARTRCEALSAQSPPTTPSPARRGCEMSRLISLKQPTSPTSSGA